ncbi:helix-turn-helix transcriptional regulator [Streptacidiphilus sp. PB12-B1b]|uniref:helix-turn-helix domain-containing protein n=1 Tax=Streptacidiphilus sp. PB12-B1b TaxID=2705012 RepID=UPI0015FAD18E|nr:AraC family transcriptional regulator [Streptacidiphilus sp. PB12-B1b]QMU75571.1 helix-turn-helix transcriptional regulator [Streptacidiphilus sp. PB12-B1b]
MTSTDADGGAQPEGDRATGQTGAGAGPQVRGVLHPQGAAGRFTLEQPRPAAELGALVESYWTVRWDLRGRPAHEQKVLAHPQVHLVFEQPEAAVYGVDRGLFVRRLEGRGQVFGVKFRPGGFRPFWGRPVQELADRVVPAVDVLGAAVAGTARRVLELDDTPAMAALADAFLLARLPEPDPLVAEVAAMVDTATSDHTIVRVEQLAARCEVSVRTLQRLFAEYVGVGPKWVLRRARLQEAALRADAGVVDWTLLAADLGYADQAHLSRDFTAVVGLPPGRYARQ